MFKRIYTMIWNSVIFFGLFLTTFYFILKNSLHCCIFLNDHCLRNVLCIVLNKFYCILFRRWFNLKYKKQSEKLKHYEGERILQELETDTHDDRSVDERFRAVGRKSIKNTKNITVWPFYWYFKQRPVSIENS